MCGVSNRGGGDKHDLIDGEPGWQAMCLLKKEYTFRTLVLRIGLNGRNEACELGCDLRSGVEEAFTR